MGMESLLKMITFKLACLLFVGFPGLVSPSLQQFICKSTKKTLLDKSREKTQSHQADSHGLE